MQVELSTATEKALREYRASHKGGWYDFTGTSDTKVVNILLMEKLKPATKNKPKKC